MIFSILRTQTISPDINDKQFITKIEVTMGNIHWGPPNVQIHRN